MILAFLATVRARTRASFCANRDDKPVAARLLPAFYSGFVTVVDEGKWRAIGWPDPGERAGVAEDPGGVLIGEFDNQTDAHAARTQWLQAEGRGPRAQGIVFPPGAQALTRDELCDAWDRAGSRGIAYSAQHALFIIGVCQDGLTMREAALEATGRDHEVAANLVSMMLEIAWRESRRP